MKCPYCKETIDDDSLFCDQCGKELRFCPVCRTPKRGIECPVCGASLISGREFFAPEKPAAAAGGVAPAAENMDSVIREPSPAAGKPADETLYLVGEGMRLELREGVFGRKGGTYPEFAVCIYVSSRHGEFRHGPQGWTVTDLGSTNGTTLNGARIAPNTPYPLKKGDSLKVSRLAFTIE